MGIMGLTWGVVGRILAPIILLLWCYYCGNSMLQSKRGSPDVVTVINQLTWKWGDYPRLSNRPHVITEALIGSKGRQKDVERRCRWRSWCDENCRCPWDAERSFQLTANKETGTSGLWSQELISANNWMFIKADSFPESPEMNIALFIPWICFWETIRRGLSWALLYPDFWLSEVWVNNLYCFKTTKILVIWYGSNRKPIQNPYSTSNIMVSTRNFPGFGRKG